MLIERTLPSPEDVMVFATDHLSNQLPAMAGLAHDLHDRRSGFRQGQDSRIGLFAAKISFILQALGRGEQLGIGGCRPDCASDLAHRFADGIEESPTGVLHQMPTICDLYRVRQGLCRSFAISTTAIAGDDRDRGMSGELGLLSRAHDLAAG